MAKLLPIFRNIRTSNSMGRLTYPLAIALSIFFGIPSAGAVPLGTLIDTDGSLVQGNLLFDNFNLFPLNNSGVGAAFPTDVNDIEIQGVTISGQHGLSFYGPFSAMEVDNIVAFRRYNFSYTATSLDGSYLIDGFGHEFELLSEGVGSAQVTTRTNSTPADDFFLQLVTPSQPFPPASGEMSESGKLRNVLAQEDVAMQAVPIIENFRLTSGVGGPFPRNSVGFDSVEVLFSQVSVPEPSILTLIGIGLVGLGFARRDKV